MLRIQYPLDPQHYISLDPDPGPDSKIIHLNMENKMMAVSSKKSFKPS